MKFYELYFKTFELHNYVTQYDAEIAALCLHPSSVHCTD